MTDTASKATPGVGKRIELTLRALVLGCILAVIFTAANTYLGLLVGLTFASAIPAAVISMAVLRGFRTSTIWENMTVQTVASVGGSMSAIIFVLPGLVMIGWWLEFPFWQSVLICALGGVLGVTFSIPLRRALVVNSDLPYPEGRAAAEVLKVGSRGAEQSESAVRENKAGRDHGAPDHDPQAGLVLAYRALGLFRPAGADLQHLGRGAAFWVWQVAVDDERTT